MQTLYIHPQNPQQRLIEQAISLLKQDTLAVIPSQFGYVLAFTLEAKTALDKAKQHHKLGEHAFTLMCRTLSEVATYATMNDEQHRIIKANFDSQTRFVLIATKTTPKKLLNKHKAIAICHDSTPIMTALLDGLDEPLVIIPLVDLEISPNNTSATLNHEQHGYEIADLLGHQLDLLIDVGQMMGFSAPVMDLA